MATCCIQDKVKVAGGLALGAAGLYLASRALKDSLHCAARREAASSFAARPNRGQRLVFRTSVERLRLNEHRLLGLEVPF